MSKSAGINFGIPNTEYRLRVDDTGTATSCYNMDTNTEYISGESSNLSLAKVTFKRGNVTGVIDIDVAYAYTFVDANTPDSIDCTTGGISLIASEDEVTIDVILYKGKAYANANYGNLILSGDNFDSETECITGAGVITIDH